MERLAAENSRLREQARARAEFMENLAHELATPLTPLVGYLKLLSSGRLGDLSEKQQQVIASMRTSADRLAYALDELVDYTALETGHYQLQRCGFDGSAMLDRVVAEHAASAHAKHVSFDVRKPARLECSGDEDKLRRALAILIDNAVRFSPHGGQVLVSASEVDGRHLFEVFDQGPGFSSDAQTAVHQRREERVGHPGLGLPVARQIAEAHGGQLFVESPPKEQPQAREQFCGARVGFFVKPG